MQIKINYEIGYEFWVPRVHAKHTEESIEVDGKTYVRTDRYYYAYVKPKTVVAIDVNITQSEQEVTYHAVTGHGLDCGVASIQYKEHELAYATREAAMAAAEQHLALYPNEIWYGD
jgi:hypothetical protein